MNKVNLTIDNRSVCVPTGFTVLAAAASIGIKIPTLCYLKEINEIGACRMCLVEVAGMRGLQTACTLPVSEGLQVYTNNETIRQARRSVLQLLMSAHRVDCLVCDKAGACKLQDYCYEYDIDSACYSDNGVQEQRDDSNPFYYRDNSKCILCQRCIAVCSKVQCSSAIGLVERGYTTYIAPDNDKNIAESDCVSCGNCLAVCPVGALQPKKMYKYREWEPRSVRTVCPYCGVGCAINLRIKDNKIVDVQPAYGPANNGQLCVKGRFGYEFVAHRDRLSTPLIRRNGVLEACSWDEALDFIHEGLQLIKQQYGADAIMGLASARASNEENYLMQKFMRAVIGTNNIDHCARLCHATTVAGLAQTLGSGAMTNSIDEVNGSDLIFVIGSNTTETHPVIGTRIKQAKMRGAKLIVAEPRRIELAEEADVFLQIKPGSNVALLNAMIQVIINEKLYDEKFVAEQTEGFNELAAAVAICTPEWAADICRIAAERIYKAARMYAAAKTAAIYFAMGITQHSNGTDGVIALSNLALLCGQIGKEFSGINPLRGQNNVQGACDMGALPGDLPGYQKITNDTVREKFNNAWQVELSNKPGLTLSEAMTAAGEGDIKAMYIMGENPMLSDPDSSHIAEALQRLELLVVQDIFLSETAAKADVVLPAVSFAEKDGTFTNTERRVQRVRKALQEYGEAKADWQIIAALMNKFGYAANYNNPAEIFVEAATLMPIYNGINYERLEGRGLQWPCPDEKHSGTRYLHKDKVTRGVGLLKAVNYRTSLEDTDEVYPLLLTTGRYLYHYHTRTMTGRVSGLNKLSPQAFIEINKKTAAEYALQDEEFVRLISRRGQIEAVVRISDRIGEGVLFMPFHFAASNANVLTNPCGDEIAKTPELKVAAVRLEKLS